MTIGHGTRGIDAFLELLEQHGVDSVVDVRTSPYSGHVPVYNRETLSAAVRTRGFRYLFMGKELGGRPDEDKYYTDGRADYAKMATRPEFLAGIERIEAGLAKGFRLVLLCSELRPELCHRTRLVACELARRGIRVDHIDEAGRLTSHDEIMTRITGGQTELFGDVGAHLASPRRIRH